MKLLRPARVALCLGSVLQLAGCAGTVQNGAPAIAPPAAVTYSGGVHGGQQPVSGALIQLYAAGTSGDGSAATPLLTAPVRSDANGNFNITGLYTCPSPTADIYLVASGGNPGLGSANPNLALMTALGPCSSLTPQSFISVNELTTVAAVYALSPYMGSAAQIGSTAYDAAALNASFTLANQFVSSSTGTLQPSSANFTVPAAKLNTLADILATCVNSTGGGAGDSTVCGKLFALSTPSGATPPTDTISALLNIANNPPLNTAQLYQLTPPQSPYQPTLSAAPADFGVQQTPSANAVSNVQLIPNSLTFPATQIGATSVQTAVLSTKDLTGTTVSMSLTGPQAADFSLLNACGPAIGGVANCSFTVQFKPSVAGTETATLTVKSNSPDSPQTILVTGTGTQGTTGPHATVSSTSLNVKPGAYIDLTLSNIGTAALTVSSISLEGTPFATQTNNCGSSLATGASCIITVHSIAAGEDQLTILTDDPLFNPAVAVYSDSNANAAVLAPSNYDFGDTTVGTTSSSAFAGYSYQEVISGPQDADFKVTTVSLATSSYAISFTPSAAGQRTARLTLDSAGNYIPLTGYGTTGAPASSVTLAPQTVSFDFDPAPKTLTLTNPGTNPVAIQSLSIQSLVQPSEYSQTNNCGAFLMAQASCTVTLSSSRLTEGATEATLAIVTDGGTSHLPLSNRLYKVVNYGNKTLSYPGASYPFTELFGRNNSTISGTYTGPGARSFSFSGCMSYITPCTGTATFNPQGAGLQAATLTTSDTFPNYTTVTTNYSMLGYGTTISGQNQGVIFEDGVSSSGNTLKVTNVSQNDSENFEVDVPYTSPQVFGLGQQTCAAAISGLPYPEGGECTYVLSYTAPPTGGFASTVATVLDKSTSQTFTHKLYKEFLASPTASAGTLHFATTAYGNVTTPLSVTVTRPGWDPVQATSLSKYADLILVKGSCAAGEVPCVLTFMLSPVSNGLYTTSANLTDTLLGTSVALNLQGQVTGSSTASTATITPATLTFPSQAVGTVSAPQVLTVTNTGSGGMNLRSVAPSNANIADFATATNCPLVLAPQASCTVTITFAPLTPGSKIMDIFVTGNFNPPYNFFEVPIFATAQ